MMLHLVYAYGLALIISSLLAVVGPIAIGGRPFLSALAAVIPITSVVASISVYKYLSWRRLQPLYDNLRVAKIAVLAGLTGITQLVNLGYFLWQLE